MTILRHPSLPEVDPHLYEGSEYCAIEAESDGGSIQGPPALNVESAIQKWNDWVRPLVQLQGQLAAATDVIAFLTAELEAANARAERYRVELTNLRRGYVSTLESARDRIIFLGGECDSLEKMAAGDPHLIAAVAALNDQPEQPT